MSKVVCFGEIMLRLAAPLYSRFSQATVYEAVYGGGEANVSVSLANFGLEAAFVSKVPDNAIGQGAVNELRKYGVCTEHIKREGERLGIYFLEKGASQRPSKVIYDRKYSAISMSKPGDFDWMNIFKDCSWFHFTGITPALGKDVAQSVLEACKAAKSKGIKVSCDLNYRKNLWTPEAAGKTMKELMEYVDVCIANEEDAEKVFGIKASETDLSSGKINHDSYKYVAEELLKMFGLEKVAITLRESISASDNVWSGMLYDGREFLFSKSYPIHIVDRVGGGDSFGAGLIYGLLNGYSSKDALEFAAAASCLKHSIEGDFNQVSASEVISLMSGNTSGRVQR